jgi:hypothetical protein
MNLKPNLKSKYTYTDLKIISQSEGRVTLHAKNNDKGNEVTIIGLKVPPQQSNKIHVNNKYILNIPQGDYLQ